MTKLIGLSSLFLSSILLFAGSTNAAELIKARVVGITDGDTLTARSGTSTFNVRLACIDAPESNQNFGSKSTLRLNQLAPVGSNIDVYRVDTDRYGRTVGVIVGNRGNVNLQMVREGYAVVYDQYLHNCPNSSNQLTNAETEARTNSRIFWSQSNPCMPWDFRSGNCNTVTIQPTQPSNGCDPNYSGACIPAYPPDLDCGEITARRFQSIGSDPHRFDRDKDGIACES